MNGIIITEKNFSNVAARVVKFFNGADIVQWHSFDCGMKRHIPTDFVMDIGEERGRRINCTRRYTNVSAKIGEFMNGDRCVRIRFNEDCAACIKVGDVVKFCGNRIQLRTKFINSNFKWLYETYQLWDENGGFKDIKPEYCWAFDLDDLD